MMPPGIGRYLLGYSYSSPVSRRFQEHRGRKQVFVFLNIFIFTVKFINPYYVDMIHIYCIQFVQSVFVDRCIYHHEYVHINIQDDIILSFIYMPNISFHHNKTC